MNDPIYRALTSLIDSVLGSEQSLKEFDFDFYVSDLQNQIIEYFNYHKLEEVPEFLDKSIHFCKQNAVLEDKKKRYSASVVAAAFITLFPFDDYIPLLEPIVEKLLRPGFKRLVMVGAMVVGRIGYVNGPNRDHFISVLIENYSKMLTSHGKKENLFVAAMVLTQLADSAPEQIFVYKDFSNTILSGIQYGDTNVRDLCIEVVGKLFKSNSASVGMFFLTDFLDTLRKETVMKLSSSTPSDELVADLKLLIILFKQRPFITKQFAKDMVYNTCAEYILSTNYEIMAYSLELLMFLHRTKTIETDNQLIKTIFGQLFQWVPKQLNNIENLFVSAISCYSKYIVDEFDLIFDGISYLMKSIPKNTGLPLTFSLVIAKIKIIDNVPKLNKLFKLVDQIMRESTSPTPIHILIQALNETKPDWNTSLRRYKQTLIRMIHELLSEPFQRWEVVVISFLALDQLQNLSYLDAVMFHSLVMNFIDSSDWQIREKVAYTAIHVFQGYVDRMPLETMKKLVDLAVDDPVRSVRKKTLLAFSQEVYKFLAQPEIIIKFSRLIQDESYLIRKQTIEILGHLVPTTSASILRELLLTTLRQLPDKYNPIIPSRITDNFPHLIWASRNFIHLYGQAIYQRFIKMLDERFNNQVYNDRALVYMNSAQLIDIDGSIIKALARVNELCPQQAPSRTVIHVLSNILMQPVHPWTKVHALKALKNICQGPDEVGFIMKDYPFLVQCLLKLIKENSSLKIITKSLKVLGAIGFSSNLPPALSKKKDIFTFRSFFNTPLQFKKYVLRILFDYLFDKFKKPMIDAKKEVIAKVITDLFVSDPDSIAQYVNNFFNVFLPSFPNVSSKTLKIFLQCLTNVIKLSGRLIVPYVTIVFQAIENLWRQQFTIEGSRVIRALIEAAYGQCDSMLHLVVPICFHLIKLKSQNSAIELFKILRVTADYTPSYLSIIIQGISDIAGEPGTQDFILGLCVKTLKFIVKHCDCVEYLPTIKRCVVKLRNNAGIKYKEAAASLLDAISERKKEDDDFEDDEFEPRPAPPNVSVTDPSILFEYMKLPDKKDDVTIGKWFNEFETKLIEIAPSPIIRALLPLKSFHGLNPKFTFIFAFITIWSASTNLIKAKIADLLNLIFKCKELPTAIANRFINLVEFSILSEIDLRLDIASLISFCEERHYHAKALLIVENSDPIFPIQKLVGLNIEMGRKNEASSLASQNNISMNYKLWMELGNWDNALTEIMKCVDPSRYIYHQVVCMAALEDWEGILEKKQGFYDLGYSDQVQIAKYFMTAEIWNGNSESAVDFINSTNGFSVDDQIMRAIAFIKMGNIDKAHKAVHFGWRYLAASVSSIEKYNKGMIQNELFQAQQLLELSEVLFCLRKPEQTEYIDRVWVARLKNIENEPNKQKELFKIRSLVPNLAHFDVHMLNVISYYIWLGQRDVAQRICDIFFPKDSAHAKYVQCELSGREEKIDEMLQLAEKSRSKELASRLQQLVGNIKLKRCSSVDGLKDVANHFMIAEKSYDKIANINILLAYATSDPKYAQLAAQSIAKSFKLKPLKCTLFAHKLLSLSTSFSSDEETFKSIMSAINSLPDSTYPSIMNTTYQLLLNKSPNVQKIAYQICLNLVYNYPQYAGFQLLVMEKQYPNCESLELLYDRLQMDFPIIFSQVSLIHNQLIKIANPFHKKFFDQVNEAKNKFINGETTSAYQQLLQLMLSLASAPTSNLDKQLRLICDKPFKKLWKKIEERGRILQDSDFYALASIISEMNKKYESMRVIRLSSISEHLERKSKWSLYILGKQSLIDDGIRIQKFFHCIGNLEDSIQITLIGNDGKRYNFQLQNSSINERPLECNQFINLLSTLLTDIHSISHGSIVQFTKSLFLYEIPKNQISMYEMITIYQQSKLRVPDAEQLAIRGIAKSSYNDLTQLERVNALSKLRQNHLFDSSELAHALLVTSKDADSWAHRTSQFSLSLGLLSAVSYITGTVDSSPKNILIDKTNGSVTFLKFSGVRPKQPIPFRLTPMLENALGRYGIEGPFSKSFVSAMKLIRKSALPLAPSLQFTCCDAPFDTPQLPMNFLKSFGVSVEEKASNQLDDLYNRIEGPDKYNNFEKELSHLISIARDINNIALMPSKWYPWW